VSRPNATAHRTTSRRRKVLTSTPG
jgi:hypothetical protein